MKLMFVSPDMKSHYTLCYSKVEKNLDMSNLFFSQKVPGFGGRCIKVMACLGATNIYGVVIANVPFISSFFSYQIVQRSVFVHKNSRSLPY